MPAGKHAAENFNDLVGLDLIFVHDSAGVCHNVLSMVDVAAKLSTATGKPVTFMAVSTQDARKGMVSMGMPDWLADGLLELLGSWTNGSGSGVTNIVKEATGKPARSYETFAGEHVQLFK